MARSCPTCQEKVGHPQGHYTALTPLASGRATTPIYFVVEGPCPRRLGSSISEFHDRETGG